MAFSKVLLAIAVLLAVLSLAASQLGFSFSSLGGGYNNGYSSYGGFGQNGYGGGYQQRPGGYNNYQQYPSPGGFGGSFNYGPGGYGRR